MLKPCYRAQKHELHVFFAIVFGTCWGTGGSGGGWGGAGGGWGDNKPIKTQIINSIQFWRVRVHLSVYLYYKLLNKQYKAEQHRQETDTKRIETQTKQK